jgi:hypothetical protein
MQGWTIVGVALEEYPFCDIALRRADDPRN